MSLNKNYSLYYNVLEFFRTIMKNHPSLNYVSQGDVFSIDTREFPQYPLGNIIVTGASFGEKSFDQRGEVAHHTYVFDRYLVGGGYGSGRIEVRHAHQVLTEGIECTDPQGAG